MNCCNLILEITSSKSAPSYSWWGNTRTRILRRQEATHWAICASEGFIYIPLQSSYRGVLRMNKGSILLTRNRWFIWRRSGDGGMGVRGWRNPFQNTRKLFSFCFSYCTAEVTNCIMREKWIFQNHMDKSSSLGTDRYSATTKMIQTDYCYFEEIGSLVLKYAQEGLFLFCLFWSEISFGQFFLGILIAWRELKTFSFLLDLFIPTIFPEFPWIWH